MRWIAAARETGEPDLHQLACDCRPFARTGVSLVSDGEPAERGQWLCSAASFTRHSPGGYKPAKRCFSTSWCPTCAPMATPTRASADGARRMAVPVAEERFLKRLKSAPTILDTALIQQVLPGDVFQTARHLWFRWTLSAT
jgi:hypothetical protein